MILRGILEGLDVYRLASGIVLLEDLGGGWHILLSNRVAVGNHPNYPDGEGPHSAPEEPVSKY